MEVVVITGLSGAGKSHAVDILEDMGYFCIDNIPPELAGEFVMLAAKTQTERKIAVITDARGGMSAAQLMDSLGKLKAEGIDYELIFMDCSAEILLNRYKETRRKHPLLGHAGGSLEEAIRQENILMESARKSADRIIDTSLLSPAQLRVRMKSIFLEEEKHTLFLNCISFGFKYGLPAEADLVFDVRCLPNPFYIPELKMQTGLDIPVQEYVMNFPESREFLQRQEEMILFTLPLYEKEGKSQLVIAMGCTGGKHRSVTFAEKMNGFLLEKGYQSIVTHRDISRDSY